MNEPDLIQQSLSRGIPLTDILHPNENSIYNPSKRKNMPSITKPNKEKEPLWWFDENKGVPISNLDKKAVVTAYLHSLKVCRHHTKRLMSFQEKQEHLAKRANELGISLPDTFEETKNLLDIVKAEVKPEICSKSPVILQPQTQVLDKVDSL